MFKNCTRNGKTIAFVRQGLNIYSSRGITDVRISGRTVTGTRNAERTHRHRNTAQNMAANSENITSSLSVGHIWLQKHSLLFLPTDVTQITSHISHLLTCVLRAHPTPCYCGLAMQVR
jgi:hypothetical protein